METKRHDCTKNINKNGKCRICLRTEYMREYNTRNPEKTKEYQKKYNGEYYRNNAHEIKASASEYYATNKEKVNAGRKIYYQENLERMRGEKRKYYAENREAVRAKQKQYYVENADAINKAQWENYKKPRYDSDPYFRLKESLCARLRQALDGATKSASTQELIGCTDEELRTHIEKQFTEGMTWDNHGITGWHVDHIVPCDSFDLTDPEQQRTCFHYTNLQPLWYLDNLRKSNKLAHLPPSSSNETIKYLCHL